MPCAAPKAISAGASEMQIRQMACDAGGGSLLESGIQKMMEGITTAEEVLKATFTGGSEL